MRSFVSVPVRPTGPGMAHPIGRVFRNNWSTRGGDGDKGKVTSGFIGNLRFSELTPRRQLLQTGVTETGGAELIRGGSYYSIPSVQDGGLVSG
jgi:hypothetical protein